MNPSFSVGFSVLSVLACGVGSMILGFLWYGPLPTGLWLIVSCYEIVYLCGAGVLVAVWT